MSLTSRSVKRVQTYLGKHMNDQVNFQPISSNVLYLVGGFASMYPKRSCKDITWENHRAWIMKYEGWSRAGEYRTIHTGWEKQVLVANTYHQPISHQQNIYALANFVLLQDVLPELKFLGGFINHGAPGNNSYLTEFREEDKGDGFKKRSHETLGAKLYFTDEKRKKSKFSEPEKRVCVIVTVRVRDEELIGFRSSVRTNAYEIGGHGAHTSANWSYLEYRFIYSKWELKTGNFQDRFERPVRSTQEEQAYHANVHNLMKTFVCTQ